MNTSDDGNRRRFVRVAILATAALVAAHANAEVFRCTTTAGKVEFTDRPCPSSGESRSVAVPATDRDPQTLTLITFSGDGWMLRIDRNIQR